MKVFERPEVADEVLVWACSLLSKARRTAKQCRDGRLLSAVNEVELSIACIQLRLHNKEDATNLVDFEVMWQKLTEGAEAASAIANAIIRGMRRGDEDVDSGRALEICKAIKRIWIMAASVAQDDIDPHATADGVSKSLFEKVETRMKHVVWPKPKEKGRKQRQHGPDNRPPYNRRKNPELGNQMLAWYRRPENKGAAANACAAWAESLFRKDGVLKGWKLPCESVLWREAKKQRPKVRNER